LKFSVKHIRLFVGLFLLLIQLISVTLFSQSYTHNFEKIDGDRFIHLLNDKTDSLSSSEIIELRNSEGIPLWFCRDIYKPVCLTGVCRMVRLKIYWNGSGNYLGIQIPKNEPLTKTDHSLFSPEDYQKLNAILLDSLSVFKYLEIKDLTTEDKPEYMEYELDGHTGATRPSLSDYVVRNAVYTCFTLWHTVYGYSHTFIQSILGKRVNKDFLEKIFIKKDPQWLIWSINYISVHPQYEKQFYTEIMELIKSENTDIAKVALGYFTTEKISKNNYQKELAQLVGLESKPVSNELILKFSALSEINNDAFFVFLDLYRNQNINISQLGYVIKSISKSNLEDVRIQKRLKLLSKDKNPYVRKLILESEFGKFLK
jgi:hypothetical protein